MSNGVHSFLVIAPGPRPPAGFVARRLWGRREVECDGDSSAPDARDWTELALSLRPRQDKWVDVAPLPGFPRLVLKVMSQDRALARRAARYLASYSGAMLREDRPEARPGRRFEWVDPQTVVSAEGFAVAFTGRSSLAYRIGRRFVPIRFEDGVSETREPVILLHLDSIAEWRGARSRRPVSPAERAQIAERVSDALAFQGLRVTPAKVS